MVFRFVDIGRIVDIDRIVDHYCLNFHLIISQITEIQLVSSNPVHGEVLSIQDYVIKG
jgi:hypothetical protein